MLTNINSPTNIEPGLQLRIIGNNFLMVVAASKKILEDLTGN